jgi:hypothetical protein
MWEPRRLTTLWAFTACYRDSFTFTLPLLLKIHYQFLTFYLGRGSPRLQGFGAAVPLFDFVFIHRLYNRYDRKWDVGLGVRGFLTNDLRLSM